MNMISPQDSVIHLCQKMQDGDADAASHLWQQFFSRLVDLARKRIQGSSRLMADEEDVALSAFKSFCVGLQKGRFASLTDRDSLWRLLVVITARKASDHVAYNRRAKRTELRRVRPTATEINDRLVDGFVCKRPTPEVEMEMKENVTSAIEELKHEDLKVIALLKLDGFTNQEIADRLQRGLSTIERKLRTMRGIWSQLG
jgi:DNA-directed RNA polymerase specialized sigma24 family protein